MTGGTEINLGEHEKFILCEFERGTGGTRNLSQSGSNKQGEKQKVKGFSARNRKFKRFFRPKQVISKKRKKKGLH